MATGIARRAQEQLQRRTQQVKAAKSPMSAAGNMAVAGAGAAAGGALDVLVDDGVGDMAGAASIVIGFFTGSPKAVYAGAGALMHRAREAGMNLADRWAGGDEESEEG